MSAPQLRPYQVDMLDAIERGRAAGLTRLLCQAATGLGKAVVLASMLRHQGLSTWLGSLPPSKGAKLLIIAHRDELLTQAADKVRKANPGIAVSIEQGDHYANSYSDVVIASIQTLAAVGYRRLHRLLQRHTFRMVVIDECHHAPSATYRTALVHLELLPPSFASAEDNAESAALNDVREMTKALGTWDVEAPKDRLLVGFTATPNRTDAIGLGAVFQSICYTYPIKRGITDGWLAPIKPWVIETAEDLDGVKTTAGDFNQKQLAEAVNKGRRNRIAVDAWKVYASDRSTLAFTVDVQHAVDLAAVFRADGIAAVPLSGETPKDERRSILADYTAGKIQVITNCQVLMEGTDLPRTGCILHAKPTKSATVYEQQTGRGLRMFPGKPDCVAEGQRVLTDVGLVPIERVTTAMKVWDGIEFVSHGGAIMRGEQRVIEYDGLVATQDHRVVTPEGWKSLAECAARHLSIVVTGNGRNPLREADGHRRRPTSGRLSAVPPRALHHLRRRRLASSRRAAVWPRRLPPVWVSNDSAAVARAPVSCRQAAMHESESHRLQPLRSPWHQIQVSIPDSDGAVGPRTSWVAPRTSDRQGQERWTLRTWQPAMGNASAEPSQLTETARVGAFSCVQAVPPSHPLRGRHPSPVVAEWPYRHGDHRSLQSPIVQAQRRVWDLLNAGPRHRFTVEGLLVSNCIVLDVVDVSRRHSLQSAPVLYGLPPGINTQGDELGELADKLDRLRERMPSMDVEAALRQRRMSIAELLDRAATFDVWTVQPLGEAAAGCAFDWLRTGEVYRLQYPWTIGDEEGSETLTVSPDMLGHWDLACTFHRKDGRGTAKQRTLGAQIATANAALLLAESFIVQQRGNVTRIVDNQANWKKRPASDKQIALLRRLRVPHNAATLTMGAAGRLINIAKARGWRR